MAGLEDEARLASTFEPVSYETLFDNPYPFDLPPGWSHIGSGSYRTAFRSPTGWVYKIDNYPWRSDNFTEFHNYIKCMSDRIKGWILPKTSLYVFGDQHIIAMEYIEGECDGTWDDDESFWNYEWNTPLEVWGIEELNPSNVLIMEDGTRAIIDFADHNLARKLTPPHLTATV